MSREHVLIGASSLGHIVPNPFIFWVVFHHVSEHGYPQQSWLMRVSPPPHCPAACNVWYLNSVEMESLTGLQAVQKALSMTLVQEPPPVSTVVHFKVSAQGITLTDNQRK